MQTKEVGAFLQKSPKTISNNKTRTLKELEPFCKATLANRGFNIEEIYFDGEYNKEDFKSYNIILEKIPEMWDESGYDTSKLVAKKIGKVVNLPIKDATTYKYTCQGKNELYGKCFGGQGKLGYSTYVWAKEVQDKIIPFTPEEEEVKNQLLKKYFGDASEKTVLVQSMIESGELAEKDAWKEYKNIMNLPHFYGMFIDELRVAIGCKVVKATLISESAFEYKEA